MAADGLDALLTLDDPMPEIGALQHWDFESVFALLEKGRDSVGVSRVAQLEWAYLAALGHDPTVPSLHEGLAKEPALFVQILSAIYRSDSDAETEVTEEQRERGMNAYRLLSSWRRVPGTNEDATLDPTAFADWVHAALALLDEAERRSVGRRIGHVLAFAPSDPDGTWPCTPVRDLLEQLQSENVEQGLQTQMFNNRGVTSRDPEAGGGQERALAARYREMAEQTSDRWPRSAAILRSLANTYEHDARREDEDAERRRKGIDL